MARTPNRTPLRRGGTPVTVPSTRAPVPLKSPRILVAQSPGNPSTSERETTRPTTENKRPNGTTPSRVLNTPSKRIGNTSRTPGDMKKRFTPTKSSGTPTKGVSSESSVLVEFNENILLTPKEATSKNFGEGNNFSFSSEIQIETPKPNPKTTDEFPPRIKRSKSAGLLIRHNSTLTPFKAQHGKRSIKRSLSEAKISLDTADISTDLSGESSQLVVGVRVRPLQTREHGNAVFVKDKEIHVASDLGSVHSFIYDHCFTSCGPSYASQGEVFESLARPLLENAFRGYNACLFAYGQTGSGKTYSMMGEEPMETGLCPDSGIIPRFCHELLDRCFANQGHIDSEEDSLGLKDSTLVNSSVEISFLEVYNEKIHDLLVPCMAPLRVREHPMYGPYVVDLSKHTVNSFKDIHYWLSEGNKKRATAATEMNDKSSRSHSLFTITLTQTFMQAGEGGSWSHEQTRRSTINLVDLAGSERLANSMNSDRIREGVSINRSLLTLGKVITALVDKRGFVPYRESVLTWLLKDSLGGNSRTAMLATVSPCSANIDETLATLRYARQARAIVNRVRVNEAPQDKLIRELKAEVARLREAQLDFAKANPVNLMPQSNDNEEYTLKADYDRKKEEERLNDDLRKMKAHALALEEELSAAKLREATSRAQFEAKTLSIKMEIESLQETLHETQSQLVERDHKFSSLEEVLHQIEEQKQKVEQELSFLKLEKDEFVKFYEDERHERGSLENEIERLKSLLHSKEMEIQNLRSSTSGQQADIHEYLKIINQKEIETTELHRSNSKYNNRISDLETKLYQLRDEMIKEQKEYEIAIVKLQSEISQREKDIDVLKGQEKQFIKEIDWYKKELESRRDIKELNEYRELLKGEFEKYSEKLEMKVAALQTSLKGLVESNNSLSSNSRNCATKDEDELSTRIVHLEEDLKTANMTIKRKEGIIDRLKRKLSSLEDTRSKNEGNIYSTPKIERHAGSSIAPRTPKSEQDLKMYEIVMDASYPYHWEHLLRKARNLAESYKIPYEFQMGDGATVMLKNLVVGCKASLNRHDFSSWIECIEKEKGWYRQLDKSLPWEIDFRNYYEESTPAVEGVDEEPTKPDTALTIGTALNRSGSICPKQWKRTIVKRHLSGIKEDASALYKYFSPLGECRVNVLLERLIPLVERLEVAATLADDERPHD